MTEQLARVVERVSGMTAEEQDAVAALILEELASEERWDRLFGASPDTLQRLAEEALAEDRAGKTVPLNPDAL